MLSILIPIYNFDITALVTELHRQATEVGIKFEVLCIDDCSPDTFSNSELSRIDKVTYEGLRQNLGRAKIRNLMASKAQFEQLLFLDCDSKIISSSFVKTYLDHMSKGQVTIGGRIYNAVHPSNPKCILHWKYGFAKESRTISERSQYPIRYFHSNNFLISKEDFLSIGFDETIKGYGYEDLVFAQSAANRGLNVKHIENYVEHLGLELNDHFLAKTERAISNLIEIRKQGTNIETNLTQLAAQIEKYKLVKVISFVLEKFQKSNKANLMSKNPSLKRLDFYKLCFYLQNFDA